MKRRQRREALCLSGPDRGKLLNVLDVDRPSETAAVARRGESESYSISLEALDFDGADSDERADFGGFTPEEASMIDTVLGD